MQNSWNNSMQVTNSIVMSRAFTYRPGLVDAAEEFLSFSPEIQSTTQSPWLNIHTFAPSSAISGLVATW